MSPAPWFPASETSADRQVAGDADVNSSAEERARASSQMK